MERMERAWVVRRLNFETQNELRLNRLERSEAVELFEPFERASYTFDASGLRSGPAHFPCRDLAKSDNNLSVIRLYNWLGTF
jgi:hypothetical protein